MIRPLVRSPNARLRPLFWLVALAALAVGIGLRFAFYAGPAAHPDEPITVGVVGHMRQSGDWDDNWAKADVPEGFHYDQYNFSTHLYATYFFYRLTKLVPGTEAWRGRDGGMAVYHFFVALLAAISVWQTFELARRRFGDAVGVGAALFTGLSTLLVQDAHYLRPEALTTVLTLAVVLLCVPREVLSPWRVIAAAVGVGLLVACKVSMLLIGWLPFVPLLADAAKRGLRCWWLPVIAVAVVAGFAAGVPGAFTHPAAFLHGIDVLRAQYGGLHPPHSHLHGGPVADLLGGYFVATLGWPVVAGFFLGVGFLGWQRRWTDLVLIGGPVLLFFGYFATKSVFFERNLSHVVPLALVIAAFGVVELVRRIAGHRRTAGMLGIIAVLAVACLRPAEMTARLVGREYTGRAPAERERWDHAVAERNPDAEWWDVQLMTDEALGRLSEHFRQSAKPVLLRVTDYNDEWTALNLGTLGRKFQTRIVADFPATFHDVPTCTLLTYCTNHERYIKVTGVR